ncbi:MAG: S8 family serine peptidase [Sandaracinaceae bacterium]
MKKRSLWILGLFGAALIALTILSVNVRMDEEVMPIATELDTARPDPLTGAVLIDLDDDASEADHQEVAARVAAAIAPYAWPTDLSALGTELEDDANLFRVTPPASEVADIVSALNGHEDVEVVEAERTWSVPLGARTTVPRGPAARDGGDRFQPDDPYYPYQWHLDQIGMPEAWTHQRGQGVVVAIIDTGVAYRDEAAFLQAPDLNQTHFVEGYDFIDNDAYPDDEHGHGTHVAGTVAQSTNNGVGVAGVAPGASIMPLRVLDRNGSGGWGGIAAAIRYAADHGAHVINMSLGGGSSSRAAQRAIDYAHKRGVLVVAAAGNSSRSRVEYPARYNHVVAVGAVRYDRELTFYSCYGTGLDVVAPGGDIRVDQNDDGMPDGVVQNTLVNGNPQNFDYLAWQGTSMAAPHVAGVGALIYGAGIQDPDTVEHILKQSANDLGDANRYGSGLISASNALRVAQQGTGLTRAGLSLGLAFLLLLGLRRRDALGVAAAPSAGWAVLFGGGLGVLPWFLIPVVGGTVGTLASLGAVGAMADLVGPWGALFVASVAPAFVAVALGLSSKRLRPALVGLALGSSAFLLIEAVFPTVRIELLPEMLVGPWLIANALAALGLAGLVARRAR